jgi:hypothetical protein
VSFGEKVALWIGIAFVCVIGLALLGQSTQAEEARQRQYQQQQSQQEQQRREKNEQAYWDAIKEHDESNKRQIDIILAPDCKRGEYCP